MSRDLSSLAAARLAAASAPPQRYGLSVMLRKAYPAIRRNQESGSRNQGTTVDIRGAPVQTTAWGDLPADVLMLVRRRVESDPFVAAQVLASEQVMFVRAARSGTVVLTNVAGATVFVDVAPRTELEVQENLGSAIMNDSASAGERSERASAAAAVPYASTVMLLRVGKGARVRWFGKSVQAPGFTIVERLAILAQDAVLEHHSALVSADAIRENIHVVLREPGATARVQTLFAGAADNQFDLGVTAEHRAPHTVSDLRAKGVLSGKAQGVYRGLVRVEKNASGSDGYQRCDALLLSPTAEVDPIPNLEIETNDVRCTHGVTVSHLNPEQLFYLQSRGLSEGAARELLVEGFARGILGAYPEDTQASLLAATRQILRESV